MKFLCDHCKAKYQIADDKVAGKTVRMKCRKCGEMIEVKSEVTETSVAKALATPTPQPAPTASKPIAPRAPAARPMATSLAGAARPQAPKPASATGSLAGAFNKSVRDEASASRSLRELAAEEEWYVAINGVPVGPIRMSELRRKAAVGAVTEDSLAWQEGLEEWRPVRTFAELAAAVREAAASGRSSLTPRPPTPAPPPAAPVASPAAPQVTSQPLRPSPSAPSRPVTGPMAPAAAARSNVVPFAGRGATAEKLEPEVAPSVVSDPFAVPAPPPPAPVATATDASGPALPLVTPAPPGFVPMEAPRKSPPWIAIAMIVLAGAFGITAALALFFKPAQQPAPVVIVSAPAPTPPPPTATATAAPTQTVAEVDPTPSATATDVRKPGGGVAAKPATSSTGKQVDPSIAALLGGSSGPSVGPSGGGGGGGGGGSLTSDQIEGVVRSKQGSVKTKCWVRSGSQLSSVNVKVRVTVGGNGAVQSASAEGNEPVVAKCIETQVRSWQFPATGGTTTVEIPFHFLAQ